MTLSAAISAIQAHALALSGIKGAPAEVPSAINSFPFAVTYPEKGHWVFVPGGMKVIHAVITEIHFSKQMLGQAINSAIGYLESFPNAIIQDPTLGGAVDTIQLSDGNPITYEFGRLKWGDTETIGIRFRIPFKIQGPFS